MVYVIKHVINNNIDAKSDVVSSLIDNDSKDNNDNICDIEVEDFTCNVPIKEYDSKNIDARVVNEEDITQPVEYAINNNIDANPQIIQMISPFDVDTSTHSNTHSSPRHILLNYYNDNILQSASNNIRNLKTLLPCIISNLRSRSTSPSQQQQQQRSRVTIVYSFHSCTLKPHSSHQHNTIIRRNNPLRHASKYTPTINTQPKSSTSSRVRDKSRSSPHHRNNL